MQTQQLLAVRPEIDAKLRDRKSPLTLLFTDLAGSAAYFEKFGQAAGVAWIEEHYNTLLPKIGVNFAAWVKPRKFESVGTEFCVVLCGRAVRILTSL